MTRRPSRSPQQATPELPDWLNRVGPAAVLELFDTLPDTVAFVKDSGGRYVYANRTLAQRLGLERRALLGRQAEEVFPAALGQTYSAQDRAVLGGEVLSELLELHLYPGGQTGWCLTSKRVLSVDGEALGVIGISRDVQLPAGAAPGLAAALSDLQGHASGPLRISDLARRAGMSLSNFERQVRRVYGLTPSQLLTRARLDAATRLLRATDLPVARIAVECGYFDHSAFTRAFRSVVGLTPGQFRKVVQGT